ncbi:MAG TPA: hypothetical protein VGJ27_08745 [Gaiellaceae bacterium]
MSEAEPVSWFLVEQGWQVEAADGKEVGTVAEFLGDASLDIFDGLSVTAGLLHRPRYVPAELVNTIYDGRVRLSISPDEFERLREYEPPHGERLRPK